MAFSGKINIISTMYGNETIFYEKMKTIVERGQRINRTTDHFEYYLLVN